MRLSLVVVLASTLLACSPPLLEPPANLQVVPGDRQNTVSWDPVEGALYYKLYWTRDGSEPTKDSDRFTKMPSPFVHGELENGVEYRYAIATKGEKGTGELSPAVAATPLPPPAVGTLQVSFELCCSTNTIGYAIWIEGADGSYVDTLVHYRDYARWGNARMPQWQAARESDLDGVTEASTWAGQEKSYTWDGLDHSGALQPQGLYRVRMEVSDWIFPNCLTSTELELGDSGFVASDSNCNVSGSVNYVYLP